MALFLPFTPHGRTTELLAIEVKERLGFAPDQAIDPLLALDRIPARLIDARSLWDRAPQLARALFIEHPWDWSGIGFGKSPDDGMELVLLNPAHAVTRRRASLMEEIVHIVLNHTKSCLRSDASGVWQRSHDKEIEDDAFTIGAACLIPYAELFHAVRDAHESAEAIASRLTVSTDYVEFRIKRAGLFGVYRKNVSLEMRGRHRTAR